MMSVIKKLFWISRPISWPNTAYPFAAGFLITGGQFNLQLVLGTLFFLFPYNLLMYGVNDVFDYESDILNPRKGGIEGMKEQKSFHPTILRAAVLFSLPFAIYLLSVGNTISKVSLLVVLFFVVAYSIPKLRFKEKPFIDSITSSLHFVGPLIYALTLTGFKKEYLPYVASFFMWGMASHSFGAVQDILPDRQGGLSSIATYLGAKFTVRLAGILYLSASFVLILLGGLPAVVGVTSLTYFLNLSSFWNVTDKSSKLTNVAWRRFIWLNLITGFVVTIALIEHSRF